MKNTHSPQGRKFLFAGQARGLTLPEMTLTISVLLVLVTVLMVGSRIYASQAKRSSCVVAQDQIRKMLTAEAHLNGMVLHPGVDYFALAVEAGELDMPVTCPESGGSYTATVDKLGGDLKVTCIDHGVDHSLDQ